MDEKEAIIRTLYVLLDRARGILGERALWSHLSGYMGERYAAGKSEKSEFGRASDGSLAAVGDGSVGVEHCGASNSTAEGGS